MPAKIVQPAPPAEQIPTEIIASSIIDIARGVRALESTRLTRRAIVALIHDNSGLSKSMINIVLNNLESLEATWLKPTPKTRV